MTDIQDALQTLITLRAKQAEVVLQEQAKLSKIDASITALETEVRVDPNSMQLHRQDLVGLGIIEGTKRIFGDLAAGTELTTREIADQLKARGVSTTSKRFVPTVYATLANQLDEFVRADGRWRRK